MKTKKLWIYYDEEGDFLEVNIGSYSNGYFNDLGNDVSESINEKTGKLDALAIHSFKKLKKVKHNKIEIYYNDKKDLFEIFFDEPLNYYSEDLGSGIIARFDKKTNEIVGMAMLNFTEKTRSMEDIEIDLPVKIELSS